MNRILLILSLCFATFLSAQTTIVNQPVINDYAAVTAVDFCRNAMSVANNAEQNFNVGDKVLIIQMKGAFIESAQNSSNGTVLNYQEAGSYEYNFVKSINFGSINGLQFENTLLHPYDVVGSVQVIKVPEYVDVEFQATLTGIPWDGSIGGIVVFEATGNVDLQANIFLDGTGFRGGILSNDNSCYTPIGGFQGYSCNDADDCGGFKGEGSGLAYDNSFKGRGRNGSGAGGGNDHNGGGAGGGNGGNGGDGGDNDTNTQFCDGSGGLGGEANAMSPSNNRILMGGAGGAGDSNNGTGTPGGNAGGTLIMTANSLTANGFSISSKGASAGVTTGDGGGGGGAGGTIILDVNTFTDAIAIDLTGGNGGDNSDNTNCPAVGGGGSGGLVWVQASATPGNINLTAPGGTKGDYTSALCGGLSIGAEDGEAGSVSIEYTPVIAQDEFIQTTLTAGTGAIICAGDETPLNSSIVSSENPDFEWVYNGASISTDNDLNVAPTIAGLNEYVATATWEVFGQSCIEEESVSIIVKNPDITIVVSPTQPVAVGDPVFLNAVVSPPNPNYTYQWEPDYVMPNDERNAVVEPIESDDFCITVTDEIGCQKTECVFVPVLLPFTGAPDAFSPNGDNLNDIFQVLPDPFLRQTSLKIFNRWGDELYQSSDVFVWDGKSNGEMQNVDTYIWVVEFEHQKYRGNKHARRLCNLNKIMYNFRTNYTSKLSNNLIDYAKQCFFIGSCFSNNISNYLSFRKFKVYANPYGVLFNPISIAKALNEIVDQKQYQDNELIQEGEFYHSLNHHSDFPNIEVDLVLDSINSEIKKAHIQLKTASFLFITLGSAWVYEFKGEIVANCHKIPNSNFNKRLLSLEEIKTSLLGCLQKVKELNPDLKVVFTLSPVRHLKDGFVENNLSKSILRTAIHSLHQDLDLEYFPAYEIVLDDLRDYRFYAKDLLHPSEEAVTYVWEQFKATYINPSSLDIMQRIEKLQFAKNHRPKFPNSLAFQKHLDFIEKESEVLKEYF